MIARLSKKIYQKYTSKDQAIYPLIISGYFVLVFLCFGLLLLPFSNNGNLSHINTFYYAVSIVTTTGLAPTNFGTSFSFFGQLTALLFVQLGGIGYMAIGSLVVLKNQKNLPKLSARLLRAEFQLPKRYPLLMFIYSIVIYTLLIEILGAVVLYFQFKSMALDVPMWQAIFHSVSAFCTAGFSLFDESFYQKDFPVSIRWTTSILSLLGSIGFIVFVDIQDFILGKRRVTLTTKIILVATAAICVGGTLIIYLVEYFQSSEPIALFEAFFQLMSAHTTVGFNSVPIGSLSYASLFFMIIIMMIGSCPSGTGGGIKITSITAVYSTVKSVFKSKQRVTYLGCEIPSSNIYLALTTVATYLFCLFVCTFFLLIVEENKFNLLHLIFEAASALSTVGLSTGISNDLTVASKLIICFLMFIGRIGVISLGYALIKKAPIIRYKPPIEDIAV